MSDIKDIIAENIINLRKASGMTQAEMGDLLNYSDKAISKWERGGSTPDISNLKSVADLFNVTVDYLITPHSGDDVPVPRGKANGLYKRHIYITVMSILMVIFTAIALYVVLNSLAPHMPHKWLIFLYFIPLIMVIWLIYNSLWFNQRKNYLIISLLVWSVMAAITVHISLFTEGFVPWFLLVGLGAQAIIIWWSAMGR